MSKRTGTIRKFNTPEKCQLEIDDVIRRNENTGHSVFAIIMGMKLRKRRLEIDYTQTQVSVMLDVTFQQIQKYECGMNAISLRNLWKFCRITATDINWFFEDLEGYGNPYNLNEPSPIIIGTGPEFNEDKIIRDGKED